MIELALEFSAWVAGLGGEVASYTPEELEAIYNAAVQTILLAFGN